jgi:hypothetical protein
MSLASTHGRLVRARLALAAQEFGQDMPGTMRHTWLSPAGDFSLAACGGLALGGFFAGSDLPQPRMIAPPRRHTDADHLEMRIENLL